MTDTTPLARILAERDGTGYRLTIEAGDGQALRVAATQAQIDRLVADLDLLKAEEGVRANPVTGVQPS